MLHRIAKICVVVLAFSLLAACAREEPIYNVSQQSFSPAVSSGLSLDEIAESISQAGKGRTDSWVFRRENPNLIVAELFIRKHYAKVNIPFSHNGFSINYVDSKVLRYDGANIHRNYNKWVKLLQQDIMQEVQRTAAAKS